MKHALLTLFVLGAFAASATAQSYSSGPSIGIRGFALVDADAVAASRSFDAIFGSKQVTALGGGVEVDVSRNLFVRAAASRIHRTGTRVFVDNGEVFPLGIALTMTMTPFEIGGGWRFVSAKAKSRFTPYAGAAYLSVGYQETSDFTQAGENVTERYGGAEGFGGVEIGIWKGLFAGGEVQYRHVGVPAVSTSVMSQFDEKDLGGFTARVLFGFGTKSQ
jgi:hypothetical protein